MLLDRLFSSFWCVYATSLQNYEVRVGQKRLRVTTCRYSMFVRFDLSLFNRDVHDRIASVVLQLVQ